jgi:hypothetical protein
VLSDAQEVAGLFPSAAANQQDFGVVLAHNGESGVGRNLQTSATGQALEDVVSNHGHEGTLMETRPVNVRNQTGRRST